MKHLLRYLPDWVLAALGGLWLAGCTAKNPVTVGQQMASRMCTQHDSVTALSRHVNEQLIAEMQAGTIKTHQQYQDRRRELNRPVFRLDSLNAKVIEANLAKLKDGSMSPADQAVAAQQVVRLVDRCDSASEAQEAHRPRLPFRELTARLTGPDPTQLPGPDGMPPPPPPSAMHFDTSAARP